MQRMMMHLGYMGQCDVRLVIEYMRAYEIIKGYYISLGLLLGVDMIHDVCIHDVYERQN